MAKSGGLFECEYCGMQYDKTRIQEMVQEIKGIVKVEGTVQVQGTVTVDNQTRKENLLKHIAICAEDRKFDKVIELTEELLKLDPECSHAYLWQLAANNSCQNTQDIFRLQLPNLQRIAISSAWKNAVRYAPNQEGDRLKEQLNARIQQWTEENPVLKERFHQIQPVQQLLFTCHSAFVGLQADGTVRATYAPDSEWVAAVRQWTGIKKLCVDIVYNYVIGLRWDGTVVATCDSDSSTRALINDFLEWANEDEKVVDLCASGLFIACLFDDGSVASTKDNWVDNHLYFGYASGWRDVVALHISDIFDNGVSCEAYGKKTYGLKAHIILGITKDGRVRCSASNCHLSSQPLVNALGIQFWSELQNVAKISDIFGGSVLFRDGTIRERRFAQQEKKWLDFNITDTGCITTALGSDSLYPERNLVAGNSYCALRADGTVIRRHEYGRFVFDNAEIENWTDIVALKCLYFRNNDICILGLRADGTVLQSWNKNPNPAISVKGWKLFESLETFGAEREEAKQRLLQKAEEARKKQEEEKRIAREKKEEEERIASQRRASGLCQHCGGELKGFFSKKCASCGKPKDY